MKVLFSAAPGVGHVHAILPILEAFRHRGHEVALAVSPSIPATTLPEDIRRFDKRPDNFPMDAYYEVNLEESGERRRRLRKEARRAMARESYQECLRIIAEFKPDLVIRDSSERGASLACEVLSLPCGVVMSVADSPLLTAYLQEAEVYVPLRAELGLPADPQGRMIVPTIGICTVPREFYGPNAQLGMNLKFYRHPTSAGTAESFVRSKSYRKRTIVATLGTTKMLDHEGFMRRLLSALRNEDVDVIAAVPTELREAIGRDFPLSQVVGFRRIDELMKGADLIVCHGGFNTATEAMGLGVPMHITPFANDCFMVAERCRDLRCAATLPLDSCSVDELKNSVMGALNDQNLAAGAEKISALMRSQSSLDRCVDDLLMAIN